MLIISGCIIFLFRKEGIFNSPGGKELTSFEFFHSEPVLKKQNALLLTQKIIWKPV